MSSAQQPGHLVVGISGASGVRYGIRFIETAARLGWTVHLMVTPSGWRVMQEEEGLAGVGASAPLERWLALDAEALARVIPYNIRDIAARPASGTFRAHAMVVMPCSMKTVAAIAHGYTDDLLSRCADVFLKERRRLVVVPRETPFNLIHLRNLTALCEAGAMIAPAMPGFYARPATIDDLLNFMVMKVLNLLEIDHELGMEWPGGGKRDDSA